MRKPMDVCMCASDRRADPHLQAWCLDEYLPHGVDSQIPARPRGRTVSDGQPQAWRIGELGGVGDQPSGRHGQPG